MNFNVGGQNNGMNAPLLNSQQPTAIPVQPVASAPEQSKPVSADAVPAAIPTAVPVMQSQPMPVAGQPVMPGQPVPMPVQPMMPGQPMPMPGQPMMPPPQVNNLEYLMSCALFLYPLTS